MLKCFMSVNIIYLNDRKFKHQQKKFNSSIITNPFKKDILTGRILETFLKTFTIILEVLIAENVCSSSMGRVAMTNGGVHPMKLEVVKLVEVSFTSTILISLAIIRNKVLCYNNNNNFTIST